MEMTPVDFVARTVCQLAGEPGAPGRVFHLANPDPVPASEVFSWLAELGYDIERLPYPEWLEARREVSQHDDDVVGGVLGGAAAGEHEIRDGNTYDDRNTRRALARAAVSSVPLSTPRCSGDTRGTSPSRVGPGLPRRSPAAPNPCVTRELLQDRVAVVTGASSGIGRTCGRRSGLAPSRSTARERSTAWGGRAPPGCSVGDAGT